MKQKFGKDESIKVIGSGEHMFNNIMNVFGILITVLALYPLYFQYRLSHFVYLSDLVVLL